MGGLPAADEIELAGESLEQLALATRDRHALARLTVSDGHVEDAPQHDVRAGPPPRHPIQDVVERSRVPARAHRAVNAEDAEGPGPGPAGSRELGPRDPARVARHPERPSLEAPEEDRAAPAARDHGCPYERVGRAGTEPLPGRFLR